jgi:xanthine/uracil permease
MLAIGNGAGGGRAGLTAIFGAVLVASVIGFLLAPLFNKLLHLFPPVVTGSVITVIGISLLPVAVKWAAGGAGSEHFGSLNLLFNTGRGRDEGPIFAEAPPPGVTPSHDVPGGGRRDD